MSEPLVSVLIPCYNSEKYILQAVESCLTQKWKRLEVIIVDDGSTDQSLAILHSITDERVKIYKQKNKGGSAARNHAYSHSKGQLIQYLDADDFISNDKIEEQVRLLKNNPPECLAVSKTMHFFEGETPSKGILHEGWPLVDTDDPMDWLIELLGPQQGSMVAIHSWLVPRKVADLCGPWDEAITTNLDGEYFARVVLASRGIRYSPEGICYYRKYKNKNSLSALRTKKSYQSALLAIDKISATLLSRTDVPRAKQAIARCYKEIAFRSYPTAPDVTEIALRQAEGLGFGEFKPDFPTRTGRALAATIGWKRTKQLNYYYHNIKRLSDRR